MPVVALAALDGVELMIHSYTTLIAAGTEAAAIQMRARAGE
jgi:hypothetical protein